MSQLQVTGEAKIRDIQGPVVANSGVITALDGDASQYVRGDGTLADFPTSTGGGSSVSYYLNSSVSQGTIGGVAYRELSKTPISGAGTDITASTNGYIASYLTDANDPALLEVPAGNFNCEFYFSVNNNTGNPFVYAEVYKYDGTTFTLIGSSQSVPEYLTNGTTLSPYYFAIPVAQTVLAITDRIAIRIYVNVDGRTVTLHTENNHLCQVVTTFSKGLTSLNNLTRQVQFLATGTSGTDFGIVSSVATHTFNLPVASATNTGKLSSSDWSTFNGKVPYTGATANVDLGDYSIKVNGILAYGTSGSGGLISFRQTGTLAGVATGSAYIGSATAGQLSFYYGNNLFASIFSNTSLTATRTYTLPDLSGTLALLEAENIFTDVNSFDFGINYKTDASLANVSGYISQGYAKSGTGSGSILSLKIADGNSVKAINLDFVGSPATYTYTFPDASGTIALTSNLGSYLPLAGGIMTGSILLNNNISISGQLFGTSSYANMLSMSPSDKVLIDNSGRGVIFGGTIGQGTYTYTLPSATGTLALTSNLSSYVPYTGATTNVNLGVYSLTANQVIVGGAGVNNAGTFTTYDGGVATQLIGSTGNLKFFPFWNPSLGARINAENSAGSAYIPLTLSASVINLGGALSGTSATFSGAISIGTNFAQLLPITALNSQFLTGCFYDGSNVIATAASGSRTIYNSGSIDFRNFTGATIGSSVTDTSRLLIASTGAATFSSSVTATSATSSPATSGTTQTASLRLAYSNGVGLDFGAYAGSPFGTWIQAVDRSALGSTYPIILNPNGGNVGIGTSSPIYKTHIVTANNTDGLVVTTNANDTETGLYIRPDHTNGVVNLSASGGTNKAFAFNTGNTERIRITSGGNVLIAKTTDNGLNDKLQILGEMSVAGSVGAYSYYDRDNGERYTMYGLQGFTYFYYGSNKASINMSTGAYTALSDINKKKDFENSTIGLNAILNLKPTLYRFKEQGQTSNKELGFIAQEVKDFIPQAFVESKDFIGLNYNPIVAALVKGMQEQQAQIEELSNKIVALESK